MAVHIEAAVLGANCCVKCAEGDPSAGNVLKSSGWVEPRRHFCKELMKGLSMTNVTYQMFKPTNIQTLTTH
jgi:hypothetical protein